MKYEIRIEIFSSSQSKNNAQQKTMDREAIEYTRQHYDAHANKMSTAEVLEIGK